MEIQDNTWLASFFAPRFKPHNTCDRSFKVVTKFPGNWPIDSGTILSCLLWIRQEFPPFFKKIESNLKSIRRKGTKNCVYRQSFDSGSVEKVKSFFLCQFVNDFFVVTGFWLLADGFRRFDSPNTRDMTVKKRDFDPFLPPLPQLLFPASPGFSFKDNSSWSHVYVRM